ncbi:hypothetical protein [Ferrovibrio sp.]|uniref:hypothetical protein n=1 Tax=Ferrovibrio sp. TaxID=1917215 RepID=UPI00311E505F
MPDIRLPLDLHFPLSGDVSQTINPWTWFFQPKASQFGLVNISLGQSADPGLERRILDEVGSYGRQLGRIGEALAVLLDRTTLDGLTPAEQDAIAALRRQLDDVRRLKNRDA